jgi:tRNA:m4X modification enzyme
MRALARSGQEQQHDNTVALTFTRLRCDLKDLLLEAVAELDACDRVCVIGKHVCGSALDLALVCMTRFARNESRPVSFALASCCRHRCAWQAAPSAQPIWNKDWHLSETTFGQICRMSGWCLGCTDDEEAIRTGTFCQELVDAARVLWLRQQGWTAHLVRYVDRSISPENIALVGHWSQKNTTNV